jgi:hypothetical protein
VRKNRRPVPTVNPFIALQENVSKQIVAALDGWRDFTEAIAERTFLTVYGSPALQAAAGIDPAETRPLRKPARNPLHEELLQKRIAELKSQIPAAIGIQDARARAVRDAADRPPGRTRCPPLFASGRCWEAERSLQYHQASRGSFRRDLFGGREEVGRDWSALWDSRGKRHYSLSAKSEGISAKSP